MEGFGDIAALSNLLDEHAQPVTSSTAQSTSNGPVQPQAPAQSGTVVKRGSAGGGGGGEGGGASGGEKQRGGPRDIWLPEEVGTAADVVAAPDSRKRPEFDFAYKQKVGSEDVFLGLSGTTPSSIHCDTLVFRVQLPGERLADIDVDLTESRVTVSAAQQCVGLCVSCWRGPKQGGRPPFPPRATYPSPPHHRWRSKLATFLPNKVLHRSAKAEWDAAKGALTLTLPLDKSDSLLG